MTNMTAKAKAILNLTFDNIRKGDISDRHTMVDVYLDGKFISTYQWNPFYSLEAKEIAKRLGNKGGCTWANREIEGIMGTHYSSALNNIVIWQGNKWGKRLFENYDKKVTEIIFKYTLDKINMPDPYEVEYCLVNDATYAENCIDFDDFCWQMGYDTDSRKAEKIYQACKDVLVRLIQTGKYEELKKLHEED